MTADDTVDPTVVGGHRPSHRAQEGGHRRRCRGVDHACRAGGDRPPGIRPDRHRLRGPSSEHPGHPDRPELQAVPGRSRDPELLQRQHVLLVTSTPRAVPTCPGKPPWATSRSSAARSPATATIDRFLDDACKTATVTIIGEHQMFRRQRYKRHQSLVPITCTECGPLARHTELSTTDVIEDELIEQPPDTVTDAGGGTDTPTEQPAPSGQDPPSDQPAGPFPPAATVPARRESAGGEPPGDTPESGSSP